MAASGKLEKMLVLGFRDAQSAETGGVAEARRNNAYFEALINPEAYTREIKLKYNDGGQGQGTSGEEVKFDRIEPEEMTFEFLFDNTGIIDGQPRRNIARQLEDFRKLLVGYEGDAHQPNIIKLVWGGNPVFKGRVLEMTITCKLFGADGSPLRAVVKVKLRSTVEDKRRAAEDKRQSPDLTHFRRVRPGDTLPLLCREVYGDGRYYLQVAAVNGLGNFRSLVPGTELRFPPIDKTT